MSVFTEMAATVEQERQQALTDYYLLLVSLDAHPAPQDRSRLELLIERLRKTPQDAERDHQAATEARQWAEQAKSFPQAEAERVAAAAEYEAARHAKLAEEARLRRELAAAYQKHEAASHSKGRAMQAQEQLARLAARNPVLHGIVTAA